MNERHALLWEEFHTVVNMTSKELRNWLASPARVTVPSGSEGADAPLGTEVLKILAKREVDLIEHDREIMRQVVAVVDEETADVSSEQLRADERRRHRLLNVGHDPLRTP